MVSIISNNCLGGALCHDLGLRFNSPTVNLQILPEEYVHFCANLKHYMAAEVVEVKPEDLSPWHKHIVTHMFGCIPDQFPYALCDDVLIICQHYPNFAEFRTKWNIRKTRINYDKIGFLFWVENGSYYRDARDFDDLGLRCSVMFMKNFNFECFNVENYSYDMPLERNSLDMVGLIKQYELGFDKYKYIERVRNEL